MPRFDYDSDDRDLIGFLHDVADAAADTLDEIENWDFSGERDGQYEADVVVDDVIVAMLESAGFDVLSEESGSRGDVETVSGSSLLAVVDPLDGSTNASRGLPWYATSICIVDRDGLRAALVAEQSGSETRYAAVRGGMSAHNLVHTQTNQLNRLELTFASFHFHRFAAAHLRGIQPVAVDCFNHASFACAANHHAAASGNCIAVTVVCHHGIFSSLTYPLRRYFRFHRSRGI